MATGLRLRETFLIAPSGDLWRTLPLSCYANVVNPIGKLQKSSSMTHMGSVAGHLRVVFQILAGMGA